MQIIVPAANNPLELNFIQIDSERISTVPYKNREWKAPKFFCNPTVKVLSSKFHEEHVIPLQQALGIEDPVLCFKAVSNEEVGTAVYKNDKEETCSGILIGSDDPEQSTIAHEMAHLYVSQKFNLYRPLPTIQGLGKVIAKRSLLLLFCECTVARYIDSYVPSQYKHGLDTPGAFLVILPIAIFDIMSLRHKFHCTYHEELFCDIKGISMLPESNQIAVIDEDIQCFENLDKKQTSKITRFLYCLLYYPFGAHPTFKDRISQLQKLKELIKDKKTAELDALLNRYEEIIKNYYESFLGDPKKWLLKQWTKIKTWISSVKASKFIIDN
jgi:hypothetical protein